MVIFLFLKYDYWTNNLYGALLSMHTITIDPTGKPIILGY